MKLAKARESSFGYFVLSRPGYNGLYRASVNAKLNRKFTLSVQLNYFLSFTDGKRRPTLFGSDPIVAYAGFSLP